MELIQEQIEKKLPVNLGSITRKVNAEFKHKEEIVSNMSKNIDLAIEVSSMESFDLDIMDEMNVDYFKLQKLYNPIFDLKISEEKEKIYSKIEKYYKKGNYKKIHKLAQDYDADYVFQDEILNLKLLKEKYTFILKTVRKDLSKIKNTFPYNQKVILEDENLCRRKKDSLNREIMEINVENQKLEKKIENKLKKI